MNRAQPVLARNSFTLRGASLSFLLAPAKRFSGVRPVQIYALRLVYILMFVILGKQTWTHIFTHHGAWDSNDAVAWCVWAAFATLAGLGIPRPLAMLPILLLEVFYKVLWLLLVAYPLWSRGALAGSLVESTASSFAWVLLPIAAIPWGYAFTHYIHAPKQGCPSPDFQK